MCRLLACSVLIVATSLGASQLAGQSVGRTEYSLAAGVSLRGAGRDALGGDMATHVQLSVTQWWGVQRRFGSRSVFALDVFPNQAAAIPSCAPPGGCQTERSLASIASIDIEAVARAHRDGRLGLSAGSGLYIASTALIGGARDGRRTPRALGIGGGVEAAVISNLIHVGVRSRYFPTGLGEIRWLATAMLSVRI